MKKPSMHADVSSYFTSRIHKNPACIGLYTTEIEIASAIDEASGMLGVKLKDKQSKAIQQFCSGRDCRVLLLQ